MKNVLIFYKRSAYRIYFLDKESSFKIWNKSLIRKEIKRFKTAHDEHYATLKTVERVLRRNGFNVSKAYRGQKVDYDRFDLVVTVGGDGTFLEASRGVRQAVLMGVNSSPSYSVGNFCVANAANFEEALKRIITKDFKVSVFERISIEIDGLLRPVNCLNDVLVTHSNPAAMSRYLIKIGRVKEEHRSSGLWIATSAGSTGAIQSAGGTVLPREAKRIQYVPRELYPGVRWKYSLTGGALAPRRGLTVISLMRKGMVYVDGTHFEYPFPFGSLLRVSLSPYPLRTIDIKR